MLQDLRNHYGELLREIDAICADMVYAMIRAKRDTGPFSVNGQSITRQAAINQLPQLLHRKPTAVKHRLHPDILQRKVDEAEKFLAALPGKHSPAKQPEPEMQLQP